MCSNRQLMSSPTASAAKSTGHDAATSAHPCIGAAAEFFAGIGLVRAALESSGWAVKYANDISPMKREMYHHNYCDTSFDARDIRHVRGKEVPYVDLATASFPCIDLSLAGNHAGLDGAHSGLFWEFLRVIQEMSARRPPLLLIENVPSFVTSKGGSDLNSAISRLNDLGYKCDLVITDARWYVPQSRRRLFIICWQGIEPCNVATEFDSHLRPPALLDFIKQNENSQIVPLLGPPPPNARPQLASIVQRISVDSERWWNEDRYGCFVHSLSPHNQARFERMKDKGSTAWATAYRRTRNGKSAWEIREDAIAGCLRTASGGSSKQALVEASGGLVRVRWMTPLEYARLQGAGNYQVPATISENQALFGFGDAVCVPAVEWVIANFINPLAVQLGQSLTDEAGLNQSRVSREPKAMSNAIESQNGSAFATASENQN